MLKKNRTIRGVKVNTRVNDDYSVNNDNFSQTTSNNKKAYQTHQTIDKKFRDKNKNPIRNVVLSKKTRNKQKQSKLKKTLNTPTSKELTTVNSEVKSLNKTRVGKLFNKINKKRKTTQSTVKATYHSVRILSWYIYVYLLVQLPMALLATISFAIATLASEAKLLEFFHLSGVASKLPETVWLVATYILLAYAIIIILLMYILYKLSNINLLSGDKMGLKLITLAVIISTMIFPIVNFLPVHLILILLVLRYPE